MSATTTNYGLKKPTTSEYFNVEDQNGNMDLIDVQLKTLNDNKEAQIKNATAKTSLADEDTIPFTDSAALNITKKITFANLKAVLKAYFDTLYNKYTHPTYTSKPADLYKVIVDGTGHVSAATNVEKSDITALGIPAQDTVTEVVDNLTSADSTKALSAKQGKVLNDLVSSINLEFKNVIVTTTSFIADNTYSGYGYKSSITCSGVTADYKPDVIFAPTEATNGNYAPVALTGTNSVTIYSKAVPGSNITIPTIFCSKVVI